MPSSAVIIALLLFLLALTELAVLVQVAKAVGVIATLLLLVGLGILGAVLVRRQGMATLTRVNAMLQAGRPPVAELFDGACIIVAGLLLLFPGLLSDTAACVLLLPPVRRLLYKALSSRARTPGSRRAGAAGPPPGIIEGEFEEVEPVAVSDERDERRPRP